GIDQPRRNSSTARDRALPISISGRANDALRARQRRASGAPLMTLCDVACEGRTKAQMAAHNTRAATSGPSLLLFRFPSVDPLTCDLPGPRIEDQAHRLAGAIVQKGKTGMVATVYEELAAR